MSKLYRIVYINRFGYLTKITAGIVKTTAQELVINVNNENRIFSIVKEKLIDLHKISGNEK